VSLVPHNLLARFIADKRLPANTNRFVGLYPNYFGFNMLKYLEGERRLFVTTAKRLSILEVRKAVYSLHLAEFPYY